MRYFFIFFLILTNTVKAQIISAPHCGYDFTSYLVVNVHEKNKKENIKNLHAFARERKAELIKVTRQLKEEANQIRINNGLEWTDFSGATLSFDKKIGL